MTAGRWSNSKIAMIQALREKRRSESEKNKKVKRKEKRKRQKAYKAGKKWSWVNADRSSETD